jgi:hypothetical protein
VSPKKPVISELGPNFGLPEVPRSTLSEFEEIERAIGLAREQIAEGRRALNDATEVLQKLTLRMNEMRIAQLREAASGGETK